MKNHFYMGYAGNKREEVERIFENINFSKVDTIIEPFAGSCALSYFISTKYPKKFKYILNDLNPKLKEMFELIRNPEELKKFEDKYNSILPTLNKEEYNKLIKQNDLFGWFVGNKYYQIRAGLFPTTDNRKKSVDFSIFPIVQFFRDEDIEFLTTDAVELIDEYKHKSNVLMFLDPPYINTCNEFYDYGKTNINIYEYLYNFDIRYWLCNVVLVLERNWIISLLFRTHQIIEYDKTYQTTKKKTTHILVKNKNENEL